MSLDEDLRPLIMRLPPGKRADIINEFVRQGFGVGGAMTFTEVQQALSTAEQKLALAEQERQEYNLRTDQDLVLIQDQIRGLKSRLQELAVAEAAKNNPTMQTKRAALIQSSAQNLKTIWVDAGAPLATIRAKALEKANRLQQNTGFDITAEEILAAAGVQSP